MNTKELFDAGMLDLARLKLEIALLKFISENQLDFECKVFDRAEEGPRDERGIVCPVPYDEHDTWMTALVEDFKSWATAQGTSYWQATELARIGAYFATEGPPRAIWILRRRERAAA